MRSRRGLNVPIVLSLPSIDRYWGILIPKAPQSHVSSSDSLLLVPNVHLVVLLDAALLTRPAEGLRGDQHRGGISGGSAFSNVKDLQVGKQARDGDRSGQVSRVVTGSQVWSRACLLSIPVIHV